MTDQPWTPAGTPVLAVDYGLDDYWLPAPEIEREHRWDRIGDNDHVAVVPPGPDVAAAIGAAFRTTTVVKLVAGARYDLDGYLLIPAGTRLWLNDAVIDTARVIPAGPGAIVADNPPQPRLLAGDVGLIAWPNSMFPDDVQATTPVLPGQVRTQIIKIAATGTVSGIWWGLSANGVNCGPAWLGIYSAPATPVNAAGTLLCSSADISAQLMASAGQGPQFTALSPPLPVTAGTIYRTAYLITSYDTAPIFVSSQNVNSQAFTNLGLANLAPANPARYVATIGSATGLTALPASMQFGNQLAGILALALAGTMS